MLRKRWLLVFAILLASVATAPAQDDSPPPKKPDPPGTARYMARFRDIFDTWDRNKDGSLDKQELAVAFRGPGAKPYDADKKEKDYSSYPDYNYLVQLDTDSDKKISRDEFETWGRNCAVKLKQYMEALLNVQDVQVRLTRASNRGQIMRLQRELTAARRLLSQVKEQVQKLQQHFQHSQKKSG